MKVFDEVIRTETQPSGDSEPLFQFLNRICGDYWDQVREVVERWFSRFPTDAQADLYARVRDNNDRNTHGALWELYLHEMLIGSGCEVKCHPDLPGRSRKPDFFAVKDGEPFYVEARRISSSDSEVLSEKRLRSIYDAINAMDSRNFFLELTLNSEGIEAPSTRKLKAELAQWLHGLDPDEVITADMGGWRIEHLPDCSWEDRGWSIAFRAIPKSPAGRGRAGARTIGLYPFQVPFFDVVGQIKRALKDKGSAYGKLGHPYIIALATTGFSYDEDDMDRALYGTTQQLIGYASRGEQSVISRASDGYWIGPKGGRRLGVSGILTVHNPAPGHGLPQSQHFGRTQTLITRHLACRPGVERA